MSDTIKATLIAVVGLLLAAFLNGGIYEGIRAGEGGAYRLNRFTGEITLIVGDKSMPVVPRRD